MTSTISLNIVKATYSDELQQIYHSFNDKPAVYYVSGAREWYNKGILHRNNDKPAIIYEDKTKIWYQNGEVSRIKGPAILWYGNKKLKTYAYQGKVLNPYTRLMDYPKTDEEKLEYFNTSKFILYRKVPYIFTEYVMTFDKKFYNKYLLILGSDETNPD